MLRTHHQLADLLIIGGVCIAVGMLSKGCDHVNANPSLTLLFGPLMNFHFSSTFIQRGHKALAIFIQTPIAQEAGVEHITPQKKLNTYIVEKTMKSIFLFF